MIIFIDLARRATVQNRLGRNFVWRELCLEIGPVLIKARDNDEDDRRSEH